MPMHWRLLLETDLNIVFLNNLSIENVCNL